MHVAGLGPWTFSGKSIVVRTQEHIKYVWIFHPGSTDLEKRRSEVLEGSQTNRCSVKDPHEPLLRTSDAEADISDMCRAAVMASFNSC